MNRASIAASAIIAASVACYPTTTRPALTPLPTAPITEVELDVADATHAAALVLDQDSIPVIRTEAKDGWIESAWFDATTLRATSRRHLGPGVVKVRVWVDPSRPNHSNITAETVFIPLANPSLPSRELEEQVSPSHPVAGRVLLAMGELRRQYGGEVDSAASKADSTAVKPDATKPPVKKVRPDTSGTPVIKP